MKELRNWLFFYFKKQFILALVKKIDSDKNIEKTFYFAPDF